MPSAPKKVIETISTIPALSGLEANALALIAKASILRRYEAGQLVFLEGDPCSGMYVVQDGWLKSLKISFTGREQVIRFVGPGEAFNEIGVFAGGVNQVSVEPQWLAVSAWQHNGDR